jgi:hypothetical protein
MSKQHYSFLLKAAVAGWIVSAVALLGCAAGGKGVSRYKSAASEPAAREAADTSSESLRSVGYFNEMRDEMDLSSGEAQSEVSNSAPDVEPEAPKPEEPEPGTGGPEAPGDTGKSHDPFDLIPQGWPADIDLHPEAFVADSGIVPGGGLFLYMLASSLKVTPSGVQAFHLEKLSHWDSIKVREIPSTSGGVSEPTLLIVADRPGASIEIQTGPSRPGLVDSLDHREFWIAEVGADPIWIRLSYIVSP